MNSFVGPPSSLGLVEAGRGCSPPCGRRQTLVQQHLPPPEHSKETGGGKQALSIQPFPHFLPSHPGDPGASVGTGVLDWKAGGWVLVLVRPPAPEGAWSKPSPSPHPPTLGFPPSVKPRAESRSYARLLSARGLCGARAVTIFASPGQRSLSLEAGKDRRYEQPSQGRRQSLSLGEASCLSDTPSHQQKGTRGSRERPSLLTNVRLPPRHGGQNSEKPKV